MRTSHTTNRRSFDITQVPLYASFAALLVGGGIYILWRPHGLRMFRWFESLGLQPVISALRTWGEPLEPTLPQWFVYCLPQALWAVALILCLSWFWRNQSLAWRIAVFVLASLAGIAPELAQLFEFAPGVYDHNDLLFCVAGTALAGVLVEWAIPIRPTIF